MPLEGVTPANFCTSLKSITYLSVADKVWSVGTRTDSPTWSACWVVAITAGERCWHRRTDNEKVRVTGLPDGEDCMIRCPVGIMTGQTDAYDAAHLYSLHSFANTTTHNVMFRHWVAKMYQHEQCNFYGRPGNWFIHHYLNFETVESRHLLC